MSSSFEINKYHVIDNDEKLNYLSQIQNAIYYK